MGSGGVALALLPRRGRPSAPAAIDTSASAPTASALDSTQHPSPDDWPLPFQSHEVKLACLASRGGRGRSSPSRDLRRWPAFGVEACAYFCSVAASPAVSAETMRGASSAPKSILAAASAGVPTKPAPGTSSSSGDQTTIFPCEITSEGNGTRSFSGRSRARASRVRSENRARPGPSEKAREKARKRRDRSRDRRARAGG